MWTKTKIASTVRRGGETGPAGKLDRDPRHQGPEQNAEDDRPEDRLPDNAEDHRKSDGRASRQQDQDSGVVYGHCNEAPQLSYAADLERL